MRLTLKIENQDALPNGQPLIQVLDRSGLQLGRAAYVDWQLPDPQKLISSEHAEIQFRDGVYVLRDKSKNGTFLNGARIDTATREVRLGDGDRLAIGQYEMSVRISGDEQHLASLDRGVSAPSADIWDAGDWGSVGAAPEPLREQDQRTPMNGGPSYTAAFEAPAAPVHRAEPGVWDSWGDTSSIQAPAPARPLAVPAEPESPLLGANDAARAIAAFLRGAGIPVDSALLRNPGAIEQAGRTLRVLVTGLFDLLKRQGEMKSVLGVERTTIRMADNNTFKFSASPDDAIQRLMMPRESDLPGPAAAERSFEDVRRHEERLLVAMNDAVRRIVERLSPMEIKRRETGGMMDMFIPNARKSAWWDELEREHGQLMEAEGAKLDELIEDELRNAFTRHL
jgi:type VI secretion system FHA domain protein